jgi:hypothetical protein
MSYENNLCHYFRKKIQVSENVNFHGVRTLVKRLFFFNTDNSFDILKNQLKRQGQQNKTSNNKKRKLSTKITPHLEEGNRQSEQESEKLCRCHCTQQNSNRFVPF